MMKNINLFPALLIIVLIGLSACSHESKMKDQAEIKPVMVTLASVSSGIEHEIFASGTIESDKTVNISTRIMGRITEILVKPGDKVIRGQLVAKVWDDDIRAKRAQADAMILEAESVMKTAQKDYERFNNLYQHQSATAKEVENVTLQYNSAKAKLSAANQLRNEANSNLTYSNLTAPFSGVITQKLADVGSLANPGMPILTIEQNENFRVSAPIAESDINKIHLGDPAQVRIKSNGEIISGKIIEINPSSQFTGGQYIIKIGIADDEKRNLYAGMYASVSIPLKKVEKETENVNLVPLSAITNRDELTGVYTVSANHTALLRWIQLGKKYGDKVEVISGLSRNEKFISSFDSKLYNGAPVIVRELPEVTMVNDNRK
ncbi:MAG: efflux RND transporter periplasmic adaptor subunit [Bacteroidetes bacterium]|nr:MAG: efflux RND transporter periplasmic adaptor subunit [Bacteroidota bacterium]